MSRTLATAAGSAVVWKTVQLAGVKVIYFARLLILARLLAPADFGLLAISVVILDFLLGISNLGMEQALIQRTSLDARHYHAAWTVRTSRSLLIGGTVMLLAPQLAALYGEPEAAGLLRLLAVRPILDAAASVRLADLIRSLQFRTIALVRLAEALANTVVAIALAGSIGVWALAAGLLSGAITFLVLSYVVAPYRPRPSLERAAVRPLVRYGRWIFAEGVLAVTAAAVLQLIITRRLGAGELGLYFLAAKLALIPSEAATEVMGSVAFPLYARLRSDAEQAARSFRALLIGLAALVLPAALLLVALAPALAQGVLGPRWEGSARLIQLLALLNIVGLLGDTVVPLLRGVGRPDRVVAIEVIQTTLLIGLAYSLMTHLGVAGVALAWILAVGSTQAISARFARQILGRPFAGLGPPALAVLTAATAAAAAGWALARLAAGPAGLVLGAASAILVHGTVLRLLDRRFGAGLAGDIARAFPRTAAWLRPAATAR